MTITYAICVYLAPVTAVAFGLLLAREYGWPCALRYVAFWLLREAERSERLQVKRSAEIRRRLEEVA